MFIKIMILAVVAACVAPFFIEGPDGEPLITLKQLTGETSPPEPIRDHEPSEKATVYKWRDENGVWQFSNTAVDVEEVEDVEIMELDGDINIMPSIPTSSTATVETRGLPARVPKIPSGLTSVSPEAISEMMGTVDNLQETMDRRKAEIDRATGN